METNCFKRTNNMRRRSSASPPRRMAPHRLGVLACVLGVVLTVFLTFPSMSFAVSDLFTAAEEGWLEAVVQLLNNGVDVNVRNTDGYSALHAAQLKADVSITKALLSAGAEVDARNKWGVTPLMTACFNGRTENAKILLDHGSDVNARDNGGATALFFSMRMRKPETVRLLLSRRANPNLSITDDGTTPLMMAIGKKQFGGPMGDWAFSKDHLAIVVDLLQSGADVDARDKSGETALMKAARTGKVEIIAKLLDAGAQPQLQNDQSQTAADIATEMGNKKAIEALLGKRRHEGPIKFQIEGTPVSNEDLMKIIRDSLEDKP